MGEATGVRGAAGSRGAGAGDVCPLLRSVDERGRPIPPVERVDASNRCTAADVPVLVGPLVQDSTCLVAAHAACPRFLAATERRAAPSAPRAVRAVTPAVLAAGVFAVVSTVLSVGFVTADGSRFLALPSPVAVASARPTVAPSSSATQAPGPTPGPTATPAPTPSAEPSPSEVPSSGPTGPADPLVALPGCPDHPSCYLYVVVRGDTLSLIADRFGVPMFLIREFNPQVVAADDAVRLGDTLRLGRSRYVVLDRCPDATGCWLYTVKAGDTVSGISQRYAVPVDRLVADNPSLAGGLYSGTTLRLIPPVAPF